MTGIESNLLNILKRTSNVSTRSAGNTASVGDNQNKAETFNKAIELLRKHDRAGLTMLDSLGIKYIESRLTNRSIIHFEYNGHKYNFTIPFKDNTNQVPPVGDEETAHPRPPKPSGPPQDVQGPPSRPPKTPTTRATDSSGTTYATLADYINAELSEIKEKLLNAGFSEAELSSLIDVAKENAINNANGSVDEQIKLFENNIKQLADGDMFTGTEHFLLRNDKTMFENFAESQNVCLNYLAKLFYNVAGSSSEEQDNLASMIFRAIADKIDIPSSNGTFPFDFLNDPSLSFNDIKSTIENILNNYTNPFDENVTTVDPHALLGNTPSFSKTAEDIFEQLNELLCSSDPGIRKFAVTILAAFKKFDCQGSEEKIKLINSLIKLMNSTCGEYYNPPELTTTTINTLNAQDKFFEHLEKMLESDALNCIYSINSNSSIEDFCQQGTGDCWLLSAIKSLSTTEAGAKLISQSIKWSNDYSKVTVYFAGVNKSVTITVAEISEAKKKTKKNDLGIDIPQYSTGDMDVLILELAMEKVYGDINGDFSSTFWNYFVGGDAKSECRKKHSQILSDKQVENWLIFLSDKHDNNETFAATFDLGVEKGQTRECETISGGSGHHFSFGGGDAGSHAFSITNINRVYNPDGSIDYNKSTISFVNPWKTKEEYVVSWNEFMKIGIRGFDSVSFNQEEDAKYNAQVTSDNLINRLEFLHTASMSTAKNPAQLLKSKIAELGLSDIQAQALYQRIIDSLCQELTIQGYGDCTDFDRNGNRAIKDSYSLLKLNNWSETITNIINKEIARIPGNISDNTPQTQINTDSLFDGLYSYDGQMPADYIYWHLDLWLFNEDSSVRQFATIFKNLLNNCNLKSTKDKIALIEDIIKNINNYCGVKTKTNQLSKEAVNKLNQENAFEIISSIIRRKSMS